MPVSVLRLKLPLQLLKQSSPFCDNSQSHFFLDSVRSSFFMQVTTHFTISQCLLRPPVVCSFKYHLNFGTIFLWCCYIVKCIQNVNLCLFVIFYANISIIGISCTTILARIEKITDEMWTILNNKHKLLWFAFSSERLDEMQDPEFFLKSVVCVQHFLCVRMLLQLRTFFTRKRKPRISLINQTFGVSFYGLHLTSKIKPLFLEVRQHKAGRAALGLSSLPLVSASCGALHWIPKPWCPDIQNICIL